MESKYKTATKIALSLFEGWQKYGYDENYLKSMTGALKDVIYQCPSIHSGYASEEAKEMPYKNVCKEHFFSRTKSAKRMIDLMQKGILNENRLERFEAFIKSRSRVHFVTSKENTNLIKYQNSPDFSHWKSQYDAAGIKLVKWEKNPTRYVYNINGKEYNSSTEAAKALGCSTGTIFRRCESEKPEWESWKKLQIS